MKREHGQDAKPSGDGVRAEAAPATVSGKSLPTPPLVTLHGHREGQEETFEPQARRPAGTVAHPPCGTLGGTVTRCGG